MQGGRNATKACRSASWHKRISSLPNGVCQGLPVSCVEFGLFDSPVGLSGCFAVSFHETWAWFLFPFEVAHSSSLQWVVRCCRSPGMVWSSLRETLSSPSCSISCHLFWVPAWCIPQTQAQLQGSGLAEHQLPAFVRILGIAEEWSGSWTVCHHCMGLGGDWWNPHTGCWGCAWGFSRNSQKRKPEKASPWQTRCFLAVYSAEGLMLRRLHIPEGRGTCICFR